MNVTRWSYWPWVVWGGACVVAMALLPGDETIPYHLGFAGLMLAAGVSVWPARRSWVTLGIYTVLTGVVLIWRAGQGVVAWDETAEIPLMCLVVGLALFHILRRNQAIVHTQGLVEREQDLMARRGRLVRLVSHEMRTPLAISTGYVDLLAAQELPGPVMRDLAVVRDELDRSSLAVDRLLRLMRAQEDLPLMDLDLDAVLEELVDRWRVVAFRTWEADADVGVVRSNLDRIRACLDTLVENAVRYTEDGDPVRVFAHDIDETSYVVGVADGGSGMTSEQLAAINAPDASDVPLVSDPRSQTGLGLSLVREAVEWRGARVVAGRAPEGGAAVMIVCPRHVPSYAQGEQRATEQTG